MQMLYNSDCFAVLRIDVPVQGADESTGARGGFEIVDKFARKGIFIDGAVAQGFKEGFEDGGEVDEDSLDAFEDEDEVADGNPAGAAENNDEDEEAK